MKNVSVDDTPGDRLHQLPVRDRIEGSGHRLPIVVMFQIR